MKIQLSMSDFMRCKYCGKLSKEHGAWGMGLGLKSRELQSVWSCNQNWDPKLILWSRW